MYGVIFLLVGVDLEYACGYVWDFDFVFYCDVEVAFVVYGYICL